MKDFESENALVIGGAGFIGSNIVDRLMEEGAQVRVLDDLSNGDRANLSKWEDSDRYSFIHGDMRDRDSVKSSLKDTNMVFLQAAKVSIPFSVENPTHVVEVNVLGTSVILDEARKSDIEKVVVASSSSVYGNTPGLPKVEEMPTNPISPYAASKLAQETLALSFERTYGLDVAVLRYFNVYGPRQRGGHYAGVIQIFATAAFNDNPIIIHGDGQQTRDFTYVDDIVKANLLAAKSSKSRGRVYNVGSGNSLSINRLAEVIISMTKSSSKKVYGPPRIGDVRDSLAGLERIEHDLSYSPTYGIEAGLSRTLDWIHQTTQ